MANRLDISDVPIEIQGHNARQDLASVSIIQQQNQEYLLLLSFESDVFFNVKRSLQPEAYEGMRKEQQLVVDFEHFPLMFFKLLQACVNEPQTHACIMVVEEEMTLHVVCRMEHKIVELLSVSMELLDEQEQKEMVNHKFMELKQRMKAFELKINQMSSMYRGGKTPSLFGKDLTANNNNNHHHHHHGSGNGKHHSNSSTPSTTTNNFIHHNTSKRGGKG